MHEASNHGHRYRLQVHGGELLHRDLVPRDRRVAAVAAFSLLNLVGAY
jgi:hypothetical protein